MKWRTKVALCAAVSLRVQLCSREQVRVQFSPRPDCVRYRVGVCTTHYALLFRHERALAVDAVRLGRRDARRDRALLAAGTIRVRCIRKIAAKGVCDAIPNRCVRTALFTAIEGRDRDALAGVGAAVLVFVQDRLALRGVGLKPHLTSDARVIDAHRAAVARKHLGMSTRRARDLGTAAAARTGSGAACARLNDWHGTRGTGD